MERLNIVRLVLQLYPRSNDIKRWFNEISNNADTSLRNIIFAAFSENFDRQNFDLSLLSLFKTLSVSLNKYASLDYYKALCEFNSLPDMEILNMTSEIRKADCNRKGAMLVYLALAKRDDTFITKFLLDSFDTGNCDNWIYALSSLDSRTALNPDLIEKAKGISATFYSRKLQIVSILGRQTILSPSNLRYIKQMMERANNEERKDIFLYSEYQNLNKDIRSLFKTYLIDAKTTTGDTINSREQEYLQNLLVSQTHYSEDDIKYFKLLLNNPVFKGRVSFLANLASHGAMESSVSAILTSFLNTSNTERENLIYAIEQRKDIPESFWPFITKSLLASDYYASAFQNLVQQPPLQISFQHADVFPKSLNPHPEIFRFYIYYLSGGNSSLTRMMQWIRNLQEDLVDVNKQRLEGKKSTLAFFDSLWPALSKYNNLKIAIANQTTRIAKSMNDFQLVKASAELQTMMDRFADDPLLNDQYAVLKNKLGGSNSAIKSGMQFLKDAGYILILHLLIWTFLISVYPTSPKIQSLFFWNENVRKWFGFGYVNLLLIHVPYLRKRFFAPFKDYMIEDAEMGTYKAADYFKDFPMVNRRSEAQINVGNVATLKGQVIIRGESGLGKTMLLREILSKSKRLSLFVDAEKCADGVVSALSAKLMGIASDDNFLKSILFNGYLDVYIDGINEVNPETRVKISDFISQYRNCHGYFTTQPFEWKIPPRAVIIDILPLEKTKIAAFLYSRHGTHALNNDTSKIEYEKLCDRFIENHIGEHVTSDQRIGNQQILSNPFDLTVAAQLIVNTKNLEFIS